MKRVFINVLIVLNIIIITSSCTRIRKDGDWDDNIKLSVRTDEFTAVADSVIITTKGSWWWISDITVNDNHFYGFGINPESESYIIKQDCFIVERRDKNTLFIRLDENPLDVSRIVTVGLEAGDYFDRVTITQKAKQ
jgi:hypothetical protein